MGRSCLLPEGDRSTYPVGMGWVTIKKSWSLHRSRNSWDQAPTCSQCHVRQVTSIVSPLYIPFLVSAWFCFGFISSLKCEEETPEKVASPAVDLFLPRFIHFANQNTGTLLLQVHNPAIFYWTKDRWAVFPYYSEGCPDCPGILQSETADMVTGTTGDIIRSTAGPGAPANTRKVELWETVLTWRQSSSSHAAWTEPFTCNTFSWSLVRETKKKTEYKTVERK